MANPERGEVDLVAGESVYTLALGMNEICALQARTGKTYGELLNAMTFDFAAFRDVVWSSLKRYHAKQFPTITSVGDFIDSLPAGHISAAKAIRDLLELNAERGASTNGNGTDPHPAQS